MVGKPIFGLDFSPPASVCVYSGQAVPFADNDHEQLVSCLLAHYCLSGSRAGCIISLKPYYLVRGCEDRMNDRSVHSDLLLYLPTPFWSMSSPRTTLGGIQCTTPDT